jgi:hypothetical protein
VEAAHVSYLAPLVVDWLCHRCHMKRDHAHPVGGTEGYSRLESVAESLVLDRYPQNLRGKNAPTEEEERLAALWILRPR